MDKKKLHINEAKGQQYPEPDVPVQDAWNNMQQLLLQNPPATPAASSALKKIFGKGTGKALIAAGAITTAAVIAYFILTQNKEKAPATTPPVIYTAGSLPATDTLRDGTIAYLGVLSSISISAANSTDKLIIVLNGDCYFKQLNKTTATPWQLKAGSLNILPQNASIHISLDTTASVATVQLQAGSAEIVVGKEQFPIAAGQSLLFDTQKGKLKDRQKLNPNSFSYASKVFEFREIQVKEALYCIGKAYGMKMLLPPGFGKCTITTRFDNETLERMLDVLAATLSFEYKIDEKNKQVLISGDGCK